MTSTHVRPLFILSLLVAAGLSAPALFAQDKSPEAPKTPARATLVDASGSADFVSSMLDFEDGSHFVMLSTKKKTDDKKSWRQIEPGETRLLLLIHMKAQPGTHVFADFQSKDLEGLFNMGKAQPAVLTGGLLYTNEGKEAVRLKAAFKEAMQGKHLPKCGSLLLHSAAPKKSLSADFAFVFADEQVAGNLRFE